MTQKELIAEREGFKRAIRKAVALMDLEVEKELLGFPPLTDAERRDHVFGNSKS